jgi:hypothetical protein
LGIRFRSRRCLAFDPKAVLGRIGVTPEFHVHRALRSQNKFAAAKASTPACGAHPAAALGVRWVAGWGSCFSSWLLKGGWLGCRVSVLSLLYICLLLLLLVLYIRTIHTLQKPCRASIPRSTNHTSTLHKTLHGMFHSHTRPKMVPYLAWLIGQPYILYTAHTSITQRKGDTPP